MLDECIIAHSVAAMTASEILPRARPGRMNRSTLTGENKWHYIITYLLIIIMPRAAAKPRKRHLLSIHDTPLPVVVHWSWPRAVAAAHAAHDHG